MGRGEPDLVDMLAFPVFAFFGLLALGVVNPVPTIGGVDLAAELITLGPETTITLPHVMQLLALGVMVGTNKPQLDPWTFAWSWITIATILLVIATPFVPLITSLTGSSVLAGLALFIFQSFGYGTASWMG